MPEVYRALVNEPVPGRQTRYSISQNDQPLTFANVLDLWGSSRGFRDFFNQLLAESPYLGFRWETPMLTKSSASRDFEFVLINEPSFAKRGTDQSTYKPYFNNEGEGVVSFQNLSGDATLIVPSPRTSVNAYGHLAGFVRNAPSEQRDMLWRVVGDRVLERLSETPLWISTAGGGVAWLHVRLDTYPKYYGYEPYRKSF